MVWVRFLLSGGMTVIFPKGQ